MGTAKSASSDCYCRDREMQQLMLLALAACAGAATSGLPSSFDLDAKSNTTYIRVVTFGSENPLNLAAGAGASIADSSDLDAKATDGSSSTCTTTTASDGETAWIKIDFGAEKAVLTIKLVSSVAEQDAILVRIGNAGNASDPICASSLGNGKYTACTKVRSGKFMTIWRNSSLSVCGIEAYEMRAPYKGLYIAGNILAGNILPRGYYDRTPTTVQQLTQLTGGGKNRAPETSAFAQKTISTVMSKYIWGAFGTNKVYDGFSMELRKLNQSAIIMSGNYKKVECSATVVLEVLTCPIGYSSTAEYRSMCHCCNKGYISTNVAARMTGERAKTTACKKWFVLADAELRANLNMARATAVFAAIEGCEG